MAGAGEVLDVRTLPPRERHTRIFAHLRAMPRGAVLHLVNDHDPKPLWYQLQAEQPGAFTWEYEQQGPECWRVRIECVGDREATDVEVASAVPVRTPAVRFIDNRGLEPPEPMVRILEALAELDGGAVLESHLDREPLLLYPHLDSRGYNYRTSIEDDGSVLIRIWREA